MKYGILGSGNVAQTIGSKLIELGHEVKLSSRDPNDKKLVDWAKKNGKKASYGTFSDAAKFGERVFNCLKGVYSIEVLTSVGQENLKGKILVDLTNPYMYNNGHVSLDPKYTCNTSLGEETQKLLPNTKVVKTLNYIGYNLMIEPSKLSEPVTGFYCGNDKDAKNAVKDILQDFGWTDTFDMGDISMSRYTEMFGAFWVPIYGKLGNMNWGFKLVKDLKTK